MAAATAGPREASKPLLIQAFVSRVLIIGQPHVDLAHSVQSSSASSSSGKRPRRLPRACWFVRGSIVHGIIRARVMGVMLPIAVLIATHTCLATGMGVIVVRTVNALQSAVVIADESGGHVRILVRPGTYVLSKTLDITAPDVAIAGQVGEREHTIIQGDAMSSTARIGTLIRVTADHFELSNLTLERSRYHLIQIAGEEGAEAPLIHDCILRDSYEQMIKVSSSKAHPDTTSNGGVVENCLFEYTAGVGPQYYIGGIDAHGAKQWLVRHNTFRGIASPSHAVAEFAVHFWDRSANDVVERNVILNCDRGVGFGLDSAPNLAGVIRNNMIYHAANAAPFADVGIALIDSPRSQVYNNTIYFEDTYPRAIEYRFPSTADILIANNLLNRAITARGGATGTVVRNVTSARASWFVKAKAGDLHLGARVPEVVKAGIRIQGLVDDIDGRARPVATDPDVGAHQQTRN